MEAPRGGRSEHVRHQLTVGQHSEASRGFLRMLKLRKEVSMGGHRGGPQLASRGIAARVPRVRI